MSNVVTLDVVTVLDIDPDRVINSLMEAKLTDIVVIGYSGDGDFYFASSKADGGDVLWLLEKAKKQLLEVDDD